MEKKSISQIILGFALILSVFVSVDLGINAVAAGIPELQDGTSYHSFLQSAFGLLEEMGIRYREDFFYAFRTSLWLTFILLVTYFAWGFFTPQKGENKYNARKAVCHKLDGR